jgi:Zn-dependent protease
MQCSLSVYFVIIKFQKVAAAVAFFFSLPCLVLKYGVILKMVYFPAISGRDGCLNMKGFKRS